MTAGSMRPSGLRPRVLLRVLRRDGPPRSRTFACFPTLRGPVSTAVLQQGTRVSAAFNLVSERPSLAEYILRARAHSSL